MNLADERGLRSVESGVLDTSLHQCWGNLQGWWRIFQVWQRADIEHGDNRRLTVAYGLLSRPLNASSDPNMQLPFTHDQFFDLFAAYNDAWWPALVVLWIASVVLSLRLLASRRPPDPWISALLAAHWIWSAVAYHGVFFTRINPAAWLFAALFLLEGTLFVWWGIVQRRLSFARSGSRWAPLAWAFVAYSLAYPVINAFEHDSVSRIPAFGVPCPTTIFTAGMLMLGLPRWRPLAIVPVLWAIIGGSAAFSLGVGADYALPIAGLTLAVFSWGIMGGRMRSHRTVAACQPKS